MFMHILFTLHSVYDKDSGACGSDLRLVNSLIDAGVKVTFICYNDVFKNNRLAHSKWAYPLYPFGVRNFFLKNRSKPFDVVESAAGNFWFSAKTLQAFPSCHSVPLVVRSHGIEHVYNLIDKKKIFPLENRRTSWKYYLFNGGFRLWAVKQDLLRANKVILLNSMEKKFAVRYLNIDEGKIDIMPHGLKEKIIEYSHVPILMDNDLKMYKILFLGQWIYRKGIHFLVQVISRLFTINPRFTLTIAGTGDKIPIVEILSMFIEKDRNRIQVIPKYDNDHMLSLFSGHGILFFPSLAESFGLVLLEAMGAGLVVVTTRVGLVTDWIKNGKNAFIISSNNITECLEILEFIPNNPDFLVEIRKNAQETVKNFTMKKVVDHRLGVYEALLLRSK